MLNQRPPKLRAKFLNRETNYEVTYSAARWPSGTAKVMECEARNEKCLERYRENAAMLQIFYEELNYETLTESPAYTVSQFSLILYLWNVDQKTVQYFPQFEINLP